MGNTRPCIAQKIFDRQADVIKIHRSVLVPGVEGAYYEDKRAGCSLADCIVSLKLKGTSNQLFHSMDQAKGTGACYILSFIDMYDMEARDVIHIWHITMSLGYTNTLQLEM
jgi:hypothetical protein